LRKEQEILELKMHANISFQSGLEMDQKIKCLENLKVFQKNTRKYDKEGGSGLRNANVNISTFYSVNDNGSIDIPWNFVL
jgi:hypothetical protein